VVQFVCPMGRASCSELDNETCGKGPSKEVAETGEEGTKKDHNFLQPERKSGGGRKTGAAGCKGLLSVGDVGENKRSEKEHIVESSSTRTWRLPNTMEKDRGEKVRVIVRAAKRGSHRERSARNQGTISNRIVLHGGIGTA